MKKSCPAEKPGSCLSAENYLAKRKAKDLLTG